MTNSTLTISSALEKIRSGALTPTLILSQCQQALEKYNPTVNAYITPLRPDKSEIQPGPLSGIPIAVKDIYHTAGIPTTGGTTFFKDFIPTRDAAAVEKLKAVGAVVNGKTNTHEIALGVTGVNPHYGAVRNPWDVKRISGGSSSGSAVAVALGMALGALGTDTGGSIRIPASLCGVVGLKPTYGRISLRGVMPLSWNLDHAGPITRTVRDAALMLQFLAGYDEQDPASINQPTDDYTESLEDGIRGWRVGILTGDYAWEADPAVSDAIRAAAEVFQELGARVRPVELNYLAEAAQANGLITPADAAVYHRERMQQNPNGFGMDVRLRLQTGASISTTDYILARRAQIETGRRLDTYFKEFDLLLLPATPVTAPLLDGNDALEQARNLSRFTRPFNLTGLPAISVPCGFSEEQLPIGLQIVAPRWQEKRLLQAAHAYEQATDWHTHLPEL